MTRDVRLLARGIAAVARRPWSTDRDRASWHRDRLRELEAQAVRVHTLGEIVDALARRLLPGAADGGRPRPKSRRIVKIFP